jgi:hypothetical protein
MYRSSTKKLVVVVVVVVAYFPIPKSVPSLFGGVPVVVSQSDTTDGVMSGCWGECVRVVCASVMVVMVVVIVVVIVIVLLCRSSKPTIDFHHVRSAYYYDYDDYDHGQGQETQETNETHG